MLIIIVKTLFVILNLMIGIYDFSFYRIPNVLLLALVVLYGLTAPFYMEFHTILQSLVVFGIVLAVCIALFLGKVFGAGDAKYFAVAALWMGYDNIIPFVFYTTLIGGGLALLYLIFLDHIARLSDLTWSLLQKMEASCPFSQSVWAKSGKGPEAGMRENIKTRSIPYGVAIAAGSILMMIS